MDKKGLFKSRYVSDKFGITKRALRYYDQIGLLSPSYKNESNYWFYSEQDLDTIDIILKFKRIGFSLNEIKICLKHGNMEVYYDTLRRVENEIELLEQDLKVRKKILKEVKQLESANENFHNEFDSVMEQSNKKFSKS